MKSPASIAHPQAGWPEDGTVLHVARRTGRCKTLGPGDRAVLWVQGCPFRCPGCIVPETLPFAGGTIERVEDLAEELSSLPNIEGITFSGGEPFAQAAALHSLVDELRNRRPELTFMSYSGYRMEDLRHRGSVAQQLLLSKLDILIDGPYVQKSHTNLRWRGSSNQRVLLLTARVQHLAKRVNERGTYLEFKFGADGYLHWMGIQPKGFREALKRELAQRGIELKLAVAD